MKNLQIIVWTNMGRAISFNHVANFRFHTQGFEFDYRSATNGKPKHVSFNNTSTVGFTTEEVDE